MKKIMPLILLGIAITSSLIACSSKNNEDKFVEKKELVFGGSSMPYGVLFEKGIKPILEKEGYSIQILNFSTLDVNNMAVEDGSVDFNLDQHTAYLNIFNKNKSTHLYPLVHIPLIPAAIYSERYRSFDEAPEGAVILIPNDPSNTSRALRILAKAGLIKLKEGMDSTLYSMQDIIDNPKKLNIKEMDSVIIPRALADVDFGHISGGIAFQSKVDPKKAVIREDVIPDLEMVVAINEKNKDKQWSKDLKNAYQSQEFQLFMKEYDQDGLWVMPKESND